MKCITIFTFLFITFVACTEFAADPANDECDDGKYIESGLEYSFKFWKNEYLILLNFYLKSKIDYENVQFRSYLI